MLPSDARAEACLMGWPNAQQMMELDPSSFRLRPSLILTKYIIINIIIINYLIFINLECPVAAASMPKIAETTRRGWVP